MAIPLSLVCARFCISFSAEAREDIVCVASSCGRELRKVDVVSAYNLTIARHRGKIELIEAPDELSLLALWLLCPRHEKNFRETIARGWEKRCVDDDIIYLLGLVPPDPRKWTCPEIGCDKSVLYHCIPDMDDCCKVIDIMEELTPSAILRTGLSDDDRADSVTELVNLLHCNDHRTSENAIQLLDRWNNILTETIQRRKSEESSCKEITPTKEKSKDILDKDPTPTQHESEAKPVRRTSGKNSSDAQSSSGDSGQLSKGFFECPSGSGNTGQLSGGLFGNQPGSGGFKQSSGGLFGNQSGSGSIRQSSGCLFGNQPGSGGSGSPSSSPTSKLDLGGNPAPPSAAPSGSLNSGLLSPNPSPPSSRKLPVSTAEQTGTASARNDGPGISTADGQARDSSSSGRAASPLSRPSAVNGAQSGGIPVINGLSRPSSAARTFANPRSRSSSNVRMFGEQSQHNRPSQPRNTQSYPNLASESQNRGSDTERAERIETLPISSSIEARENALFTAVHRKKFKHKEIDTKLLHYIRSTTADNGKRVNASSGDVYVLQNPAWPNHVKIGESARDTDKRIKELKRYCKIESLEQVVDTEQKYFLNYKIVEKLCHEELKNFRKIHRCQWCKTSEGKQKRHQEWFEVKPEIAVRTVQKWRRWMSLSPYDGDGNLVPWWREKANDELFFKEEPFDVKDEAIDDHDSRHQRWSRWLKKPTVKERADFEFWKFFLFTRPKRKSVWNTAEENLGPLLIYFVIALFLCGPRNWVLLVLLHLLIL